MITIAIHSNNKLIVERSAVRIKGENGKMCEYDVNDGNKIKHHHNEGVVKLAIKMLEGIGGL